MSVHNVCGSGRTGEGADIVSPLRRERHYLAAPQEAL